MIPLRDQELLRQRFDRDLNSRVRIDYFTQKPSSLFVPGRQPCAYCEDVRVVLEELASLSSRIALTLHDFEEKPELARELGVDKVPGIVIRGQNNRPVRFFGAPLGIEFTGFVESMLDAAAGRVDLQPETLKQLRKLKTDVRLQVMVAPMCPYSPALARTACELALGSVRIKTDVVDVTEFPAVIARYAVRATPTTVIGEDIVLPGAMDESALVQTVLRAAEGRAPESPIKVGPMTPLTAPPSPQPQQAPPAARLAGSGLIIPR